MENVINVLTEFESMLDKMEDIGYIGFFTKDMKYHFDHIEFVKLAKELNTTLQFEKYIESDDLYISTIFIGDFEIYALFYGNEKERYEVTV